MNWFSNIHFIIRVYMLKTKVRSVWRPSRYYVLYSLFHPEFKMTAPKTGSPAWWFLTPLGTFSFRSCWCFKYSLSSSVSYMLIDINGYFHSATYSSTAKISVEFTDTEWKINFFLSWRLFWKFCSMQFFLSQPCLLLLSNCYLWRTWVIKCSETWTGHHC